MMKIKAFIRMFKVLKDNLDARCIILPNFIGHAGVILIREKNNMFEIHSELKNTNHVEFYSEEIWF